MPQYITYRTDLPMDCILELKDIALSNTFQAKEPEAVADCLTAITFLANLYPGHPVAMMNMAVDFDSLAADQQYPNGHVATEGEKAEMHNLVVALEPATPTAKNVKAKADAPQVVGKLGDGTLLNALLPILLALLKKFLNVTPPAVTE